MKKVVVLGAGISGLSAAWYLKQRFGKGVEVTIFEKADRVGGWIQTRVLKNFLFEEGPRGFRPTGKGKNTLRLVDELGLQKELVSANLNSKIRYLSLNETLHPLSFRLLMRHGLLKALCKDLVTKKSQEEEESIASFFNRRFGQKLTDLIIDPVCKGIFGGDCRQLSLRSSLPSLWDIEKKHRCVILGLLKQKREKSDAPLYSFQNGMESLPKRLAEKIEGEIHLKRPIHSLAEIEADLLISALPLSCLAPLLGEKDPLEYATISLVNLGWQGQLLKKRGYGFLIPPKEKKAILGMTWDSEVFPEHNRRLAQTRLCVMIEGSLSNESLLSIALQGVQSHLGIFEKPYLFSIKTATKGIPQYKLFYHKQITEFKKRVPPNIITIGNCFDGVSVNDCIFNAKRAVESVVF